MYIYTYIYLYIYIYCYNAFFYNTLFWYNCFSYRLPPVAPSPHVIPHSLPILSHPLVTCIRVAPLPFSGRKDYKMNT